MKNKLLKNYYHYRGITTRHVPIPRYYRAHATHDSTEKSPLPR